MEIKKNVAMVSLTLEERFSIAKVTQIFSAMNQESRQGKLIVMDNFDTDCSISKLAMEIEIYLENLKKNS